MTSKRRDPSLEPPEEPKCRLPTPRCWTSGLFYQGPSGWEFVTAALGSKYTLLYLSDVEDSELAIKGCGGPGHPTSHYPAKTFDKGRERLALAEAAPAGSAACRFSRYAQEARLAPAQLDVFHFPHFSLVSMSWYLIFI